MAAKEERRQVAEKNLADLHENIAAAVEAMQTPEGWKAWLDITASFPQYSLNNQLALLKQSVDRGIEPRAFASFRRWKEAGYPVRKGEQSFRVLGPVLKKRPHDKESGKPLTEGEADNRDPSTIAWKRVPVAFKAVPVFEISQTEGAELTQIPPELVPERLTGLAPDGLIERLTAYAASHDTPVEYQPLAQLGGANGYFRANRDGSNRRIVVGADLDEAARAKTLIHEIAHMRLHIDQRDMDTSTKEIEAESTAYVVAAQFGLDTGQYTFRYVGGWSGYDADAIRQTAQRVIDISAEITDAVRVTEEVDSDANAEERAADLTSRTEVVAEQATETADAIEGARATISLADTSQNHAATVRQSAYSTAAHHGLGVASEVLHDGTLSLTRDDAANLTVEINDDAGDVRLSWTSYDWEPHGMEYQGEWEQSVPAADALESIKSTVRAWAVDSNPVETRGQEDIVELSAATTSAPGVDAAAPVFTSDDLVGDEALTDDGAIRRGDFIISRGSSSEPPLIVTDGSGNHHHTAMIADVDRIRQFIDIWQEDRNSIGHDDPLISATDARIKRLADENDLSSDTIVARQILSNRTSRPGVINYAGTSSPTVPLHDIDQEPAHVYSYGRDYLEPMNRIEEVTVSSAGLTARRTDGEKLTATATAVATRMRIDWTSDHLDGTRTTRNEYVDRENAHEHVVDTIVAWKDKRPIVHDESDSRQRETTNTSTAAATPTPRSFEDAMSTMHSAMSDGQFALNLGAVEPDEHPHAADSKPGMEM